MRLGPFGFFERMHANGTPLDAWNVAALHWTWSITWRWVLTVGRDTGGTKTHLRWRDNGSMALRIPRVGYVSFSWQPNMRKRGS